MDWTVPVLASVLVTGVVVGALIGSDTDVADSERGAGAVVNARAYDPKDCGSGFSEGGVVDYAGPGGIETADQARSRGEAAMLRADVVRSRRALTVDTADRQVWTYYAASGASVAEILLERYGDGWRVAGSQQCALEVAADLQRQPSATSK